MSWAEASAWNQSGDNNYHCRPCWYYQAGNCWFADCCWYSHESDPQWQHWRPLAKPRAKSGGKGRAVQAAGGLVKFLNGEQMSGTAFASARQVFVDMRAEHIKRCVESAVAAEWLLEPGVPSFDPPAMLIELQYDRGGTYYVHGVRGDGFSGPVSFHEGDMISRAYIMALSGQKKVGVLNMANPNKPGGGFLRGARAQEEQLCHRSDVFPRLKVYKWLVTSRNEPHIPTGACLVTPNVDIFREGKLSLYTPIEPARLTVLSTAARHYKSKRHAREDIFCRQDLLANWLAVLAGAAEAKVEVLVVSALGCGAFNNPPDICGSALALALRLCDPGGIQEVEVVIWFGHSSPPTSRTWFTHRSPPPSAPNVRCGHKN